MTNPFETLDKRLSNIENLLLDIKHPNEPEAKELLTISETAELLSVNKATVWRYTQSGKLKQYGISGRTYYKRSEVLDAVKPLK